MRNSGFPRGTDKVNEPGTDREEARVAKQISAHAYDGASSGQETHSWIGNAVPDSLVTYPECHNLSGNS